MKKTAMTLAVLTFAGLASLPVSAAPLSAAAEATKGASGAVELVRDRNRNGIRDRWERRHYRDWRRDRRYYRYRNWNRYGYRPYNWRSRGCVAIGPIWFCP